MGIEVLENDGLTAFVAIAESHSFSRAADHLGIAQSVISKRLSRLEDRLGTRLIARGGRSDVTLTRVGGVFLTEARKMLAEMAMAERRALRLCRGERGPVRIGYVFSAAMSGTLNHLLRFLRERLPDIEFEISLMETPEQLFALESCKIDVALVRPRPSYPVGCHAVKMHAEPLLLCFAANDPLAEYTEIHPETLAGKRFIVPQFHEKVGLIDHLYDLARFGGFTLSNPTRTKDFVTAVCLASTGDGIVLAPSSLANLGLSGVCFRPIEGFNPIIGITLLYHEDMPSHMRQFLSQITPMRL